MRRRTPLSQRGQSDFLAIGFATLLVAIIMGVYYGVFLFATSFTSPVIAAFISTGILAIILGVSIHRKFKYGQVVPERYLPDIDTDESENEVDETQKILERTRKIDKLEEQTESSTILSETETDDSLPDPEEIDIKGSDEDNKEDIDVPETLSRELYMKVLKDDSFTLADAKREAAKQTDE